MSVFIYVCLYAYSAMQCNAIVHKSALFTTVYWP